MSKRLEQAILERLAISPKERILWWNGDWWT